MAKQSTAELVASEINDWIERTADMVAGALLDSPLAPQVVQPPKAELLAYYRSPGFQALLFNADGTPNASGRQSLMDQVGADGYEAVATALATHGPLPPPAARPAGPVIPVPTPHPTNTTLALGQMPDPTAVPMLATPGGA